MAPGAAPALLPLGASGPLPRCLRPGTFEVFLLIPVLLPNPTCWHRHQDLAQYGHSLPCKVSTLSTENGCQLTVRLCLGPCTAPQLPHSESMSPLELQRSPTVLL